MGKNEVTREQKFEEYRNSMTSSESEVKTKENVKSKKAQKPTLKPLIVEAKKAKRKRCFWYFFLVSLFAIASIIVLIYFGVKIYG